VECHNGVVVSVSGLASDIGVSILKQGGNAVDAAVATAVALAVTYPAAGNLGGGGFMLVHPAPGEGEPVAFVYRETAPAAAVPTMFTKEDNQYMYKSVAVPGTVGGLGLAHQRFGTLPWSQLRVPAVMLAREGYKNDRSLARRLNT
jgi:gamma-glutamyltranspeptidase/glutathione hydrolase